MTPAAPRNARILTTGAGSTAHERAAEYLGERDVSAALAAVDAALAVIACAASDGHVVAAALLAAGAFARVEGRRLIFAGTRAALDAARTSLAGEPRAIADELARAFAADRSQPVRLRARTRTLPIAPQATIMGILNVTPDSFHDRGRHGGVERACERAAEMVAQGAEIIDIGGQSYAHWNPRIAAEEERDRVLPVVRALVRDGIDAVLSVDTCRASVAEAALDAGAHLINDCSGLSDDALAAVVARYDAGLVVMHLRGELNVRAAAYPYDDAMGEILDFLRDRTDRALAAGVAAESIVVDPGLEFGKEPATDLEILARFGDLRSLGYPILLAASRKSFLGRVFDRPSRELLVPSLASAALGIAAGATLVRVHDVAETAQLATMLAAVHAERRATLGFAAVMPGTGR
ncbi:MAG: hypothetical protein NVS3B16_03780 [Vulcanimicrobiaceae bacterium]